MRHLQTVFVVCCIIWSCFDALAGTVQTQPIQIHASSVEDALTIYAQVTGRTLLYGSLQRISLNLETAVTNKAQALDIIEQALRNKKIATLVDGEKFVVIVPESRRQEALEILKRNSLRDKEKGKNIQAGTINIPNVPVVDAMQLYVGLRGAAGVEQNPDFPIPPLLIHLVSQTGLTCEEAIHAFDIVFALNGFKMMPGTNRQLKPAALSFPKK